MFLSTRARLTCCSCEYLHSSYDLLMALSMFVQLIGPETGFNAGGAGKAMRYLLCASLSGSSV